MPRRPKAIPIPPSMQDTVPRMTVEEATPFECIDPSPKVSDCLTAAKILINFMALLEERIYEYVHHRKPGDMWEIPDMIYCWRTLKATHEEIESSICNHPHWCSYPPEICSFRDVRNWLGITRTPMLRYDQCVKYQRFQEFIHQLHALRACIGLLPPDSLPDWDNYSDCEVKKVVMANLDLLKQCPYETYCMFQCDRISDEDMEGYVNGFLTLSKKLKKMWGLLYMPPL